MNLIMNESVSKMKENLKNNKNIGLIYGHKSLKTGLWYIRTNY